MKENKIGWIKIIVIYSDQLAMKPNIAKKKKEKKKDMENWIWIFESMKIKMWITD